MSHLSNDKNQIRKRLEERIILLSASFPDIAVELTGAVVAMASSGPVGVGLASSMMLLAAFKIMSGVNNQLAINNLKEFDDEFAKRVSKIEQDFISSDRFQILTHSILEQYFSESDNAKRKFLREYWANVATGIYPSFDNHSALLDVLRKITPKQYSALVAITAGIRSAMKWEQDNIGKLSFSYPMSVILNNLKQIDTPAKFLLRERSLDINLRTLSNLNLIYTVDRSSNVLSNGGSGLSVISISSLGSQLQQFINPEIDEKFYSAWKEEDV